MGAPRAAAASAWLPNGLTVIANGQISTPSAAVFDFVSGQWTSVPSSTYRQLHTATFAGTGSILIAGGVDADINAIANAELFTEPDPQCAQSACDPRSGQCALTSKADGTTCSDGDACLQTQACESGLCVGSNPVQCAAAGLCQAGICDAKTGQCSTVPMSDGTACSDGNLCSQGETCSAGACVGKPVVCPPADQCHATESCDPTTGTGSYVALPDGTSCNDGNACTQSDTCQAGVCTGSSPVACAAPDQCHLAGACNPSTGVCSNPALANGTACNDGNACTQTDTCQAGACTGSNPVTCGAGDQCHGAGTCDPTTGACSTPTLPDGTACNDGNAWTQTDACLAGVCAGSNPVVCPTAPACQSVGACNPFTGQCPLSVIPNGASCDDGNACTRVDFCQQGACVGTSPVTCNPLDTCHAAGTCDMHSGACTDPVLPDGTTCNDGNKCTQTDTCVAGACSGKNPVQCTASDQCHVAGTCDPAVGACSNPAKPDGAACSDGNLCTQTDTCQAGSCVGANVRKCPATDQCHSDGTCDGATGLCVNLQKVDGTACSDGNACTQTDICQGGTCSGQNPVTCAAADQCHAAGLCDPASGRCSQPPVADGTGCNDGNACTQTDTCQSGSCRGSNPVVCAAPDACHAAGSCDPTTGTCAASPAADGTPCNDNNACTQGETCKGGACVAATTTTCPQTGDACRPTSCAPLTGLCASPAKPNPFFDRIFEATSFPVSVAPVFELFGDHKSVFAQVATGPDQILGALRITPT